MSLALLQKSRKYEQVFNPEKKKNEGSIEPSFFCVSDQENLTVPAVKYGFNTLVLNKYEFNKH